MAYASKSEFMRRQRRQASAPGTVPTPALVAVVAVMAAVVVALAVAVLAPRPDRTAATRDGEAARLAASSLDGAAASSSTADAAASSQAGQQRVNHVSAAFDYVEYAPTPVAGAASSSGDERRWSAAADPVGNQQGPGYEAQPVVVQPSGSASAPGAQQLPAAAAGTAAQAQQGAGQQQGVDQQQAQQQGAGQQQGQGGGEGQRAGSAAAEAAASSDGEVTAVAFETLMTASDRLEVAWHSDIEDEAQSVAVRRVSQSPAASPTESGGAGASTLAQTGVGPVVAVAAAVSAAALAGIAALRGRGARKDG